MTALVCSPVVIWKGEHRTCFEISFVTINISSSINLLEGILLKSKVVAIGAFTDFEICRLFSVKMLSFMSFRFQRKHLALFVHFKLGIYLVLANTLCTVLILLSRFCIMKSLHLVEIRI